MSYRNPQIIVDRSAEVYAKLPGMVGQQFAQGIGNYLEFEAKSAEAQRKKDQAYLTEFNKQEEKFWNRLQKGLDTKKIDDINFIEQVKGLVATKLEGDGEDIGIIKKKTAISMGSVSGDIARQYRKDIKDYEAWEARTINNIGAYEVQAEKYSKLNASTYGKTHDFAGVGNNKFMNMVAVSSFNDKEVSGVEVNRVLTDDEIIINGKIKKNSSEYRNYVAQGIIEEDGDGFKEKDGFVTFEWRRNANDPLSDLIIDLMPPFDYVKASEDAGIQDSKGNVDKSLYDIKTDREVTTEPFGENKVQDVTKIYINEDALRTNKVFVDEAKAYAAGFAASSYDQKLNYASRLGFTGAALDKFMTDSDLQQSQVMRKVIQNNIQRLTGANRLFKDEDTGRMYIKEYGTPYKKPTEKEVKDEAASTDISYIEDIKIPIQEGPALESGKRPVDLIALENDVLNKQGFQVVKAEAVGGVDKIVITKSIAGTDNKAVITEDMTPQDIKRQIELVETGKLPAEKEGEEDFSLYKINE
jgi:hypothetical protein